MAAMPSMFSTVRSIRKTMISSACLRNLATASMPSTALITVKPQKESILEQMCVPFFRSLPPMMTGQLIFRMREIFEGGRNRTTIN